MQYAFSSGQLSEILGLITDAFETVFSSRLGAKGFLDPFYKMIPGLVGVPD